MLPPLNEVVKKFPFESCFTLWPLGPYGIAANEGGLSKTKRVEGFSFLCLIPETGKKDNNEPEK